MTSAVPRGGAVRSSSAPLGSWPMTPALGLPERHPALWILGSAALGVWMDQIQIVATAHGAIVILLAGVLALTSRRMPMILIVLVYGGLCDVLWRTTHARVPWEASKYLLIFVSIMAMARLIHDKRRIAAPAAVVLCLAPAALSSFAALPFAVAKNGVAFTLLGPVALAACTALCRQLVVTRQELRGLLWWALSPCISVGAIAAWNTATAGTVTFGNESLYLTSGGFGPNQVSTVLGLGALLVLAIALSGGSGRPMLFASVAAVGLVAQALITLSRGGIYALALASTAMITATLLQKGNRSRAIAVLVVGGLFTLLVFNWAQGFSGGAVENRFAQNDSGRGRIASTEIALFRQHPLVGVGAGRAKAERVDVDAAEVEKASHNEYSRLLAEHGLFGIIVIGLLALMTAQAFLRGIDPGGRAISLGFCIWSFASMSHSATRLAAVGLIFGLASLRVEPDDSAAAQVAGDRR